MKTIGFFNNKGGVGKTSLVFHLSWMLSLQGLRVLAVDLDPQANLTSMFVEEERLEEVLQSDPRPTLYGALAPRFNGVADITTPSVEPIAENLGLLLGDLELSRFEDALSQAWPKCYERDQRSFRDMSAFARVIAAGAEQHEADYALIDVGPNLGPLNRSALLACDHVVVPLGADIFSLQGLRNMGPTLRQWRESWGEMSGRNPEPSLRLPAGTMAPAGYVVSRHSMNAGRPAKAFERWITRIPQDYSRFVLNESEPLFPPDDAHRLAQLKDYRSLMPMAQQARKPAFLLRPADGAFGGHQNAVRSCYEDFRALAQKTIAVVGT